jgi:hypothetical protein
MAKHNSRSGPRLINPHTGHSMTSEKPATLYMFDPAEDISLLELATILRNFMGSLGVALQEPGYEAMPEDLRRHFSEVPPPPDASIPTTKLR